MAVVINDFEVVQEQQQPQPVPGAQQQPQTSPRAIAREAESALRALLARTARLMAT